MKLSRLDDWLSKYENAEFNLGESGVENMLLNQVLSLVEDKRDYLNLTFDHNETKGSQRLREQVASLYQNITLENILITAGVSEALLVYFHSRFTPGSNVIVPVPTFHSLYDVPAMLGYEVKKIPLSQLNNFELSVDLIVQAVDEKTRTIILNSPNNPSGVVYSKEALEEIADAIKGYDCDLVIDEHYRLLSLNPQEPVAPSAIDYLPEAIVFGSAGKCLGCVGLRVGWLAANKRVIQSCDNVKLLTTHAISKVNDYLMYQILSHRKPFIDRFASWIKENIECFDRLQKKHSDYLGWFRPMAGTMGFPFLKQGLGSLDFCRELVEKKGVLVLPGECFDVPGYFRMRLGVRPEYFNEAMNRMAELLEPI